MPERLQKVLAHAGVASRRAAERLVEQGRVSVNGQVVQTLGVRVDAERDRLAVDGTLVTASPRSYLLLHKPVGYVSTARDERGRRTVLDLLPAHRRLYPVGRLDADSEGLLLLTDDGDLAQRLTHPRYGVPKEYRALVRGLPDGGALAWLRQGVALDEGTTAPARVSIVAREGGHTWLSIELRQGWKRQVRRMLAAVGHPVERLVRIRVGSLVLGMLPPGGWRPLTDEELARLRRETGLTGPDDTRQYGRKGHRD